MACDEGLPTTVSSFEVTIENLTNGETATDFSEGVYVINREGFPLFFQQAQDFGQGLEFLAEDGIADSLFQNLQDQTEFESGLFPSINSGSSISFTIEGAYGDFFNFATMFLESNDLFLSFNSDGIPLFEANGDPISGDKSASAWLWDLGTEVNEQPFQGPNQALRQNLIGAGEVERGRVDLVMDGFNYQDKFSLIRISIRPL